MTPIPYSQAMRDRNIVGDAYDGPSWDAWRVIHARLDGEPPPADLVPHWSEIWAELSGGLPWSMVRPDEWWIIASRRTAKTRETARRAAWRAVTFDPAKLSPGERAVVAMFGTDRQQAGMLLSYASGFLHASPLLEKMIESENSEEIRLVNRVVIRVMTASFRTLRGPTLLEADADESAFWFDDGANPDRAVFGAIRPALVTLRGQLGSISSPYRRSGELWRVYKRYFGQANDRFLVLKAPWRLLNPTLDEAVIRDAVEDDREQALSEWYAEFRTDIESFASDEAVTACTIPDRLELPRQEGVRYIGFTDPSGGGQDSFTLAVAHFDHESRKAVLDCVRERRPPFSPDEVTGEFSTTLKQYGLSTVHGDRFGGHWPRERFQKHGVSYYVSDKTKSEIYAALLPVLNSGRCELLDLARLRSQLLGLERRLARGTGRPNIDHLPGQFDDLINSAAGALALAAERYGRRTRSVAQLGWG